MQGKFLALAQRLQDSFVERAAVVDDLVCAALAGEHVLLLGPPGTAKSALARAFCGAISGAEYFEWLLSKFSAPEELFGPISLSGLKEDRYNRITAGKLPECHVAFLDEIFKANSGILNALLTAVNERKFHNGPKPTDIPLRMVVGASNELPEGPELGALYDRFLVRHWVDYVSSPDAFVAVMLGAEGAAEEPALSLQDWDVARASVAQVEVDQGIAQELYKLRVTLGNDGVAVSDRRWKRSVKLLRANAWLSGDARVTDEHLGVLSNVLWDNPQQRAAVQTEVAKVTSSIAAEATKVADVLVAQIEALPPAPSPITQDYQDKLVALNREGGRATQKLQVLSTKARNDRQRAAVAATVKQVQSRMAPVRQLAREALGLG
jgi:MoxR-like ATPase